MSGTFDKDMTGVLSRNERREKDTHPEFTGAATIDGVDFFVDAWVKERRDGSGKFFSLRFKRRDKQPNAGAGARAAPNRAGPAPDRRPFEDDSVPF